MSTQAWTALGLAAVAVIGLVLSWFLRDLVIGALRKSPALAAEPHALAVE